MVRHLRSRALLITLVILVTVLAGCVGGFTLSSSTYTVSGRVTDGNDSPIEGVTLSFGSFGTAVSGPDGTWSKSGLKGSVDVQAAKSGWSFSPASITVTGSRNDVHFQGTVLDATVVIVEALVDPNPSWPPSSNHDRVRLSLENTGGPGYFKVQFWGTRPNVVNPPLELFGETEVYEVDPGWSDTAAWDVWTPSTSITVTFIKQVVVLSRNKGELIYRETSWATPLIDHNL